MRTRGALIFCLAVLAAGCGGSGARPAASAPPPAVGKGQCLTARSAALEVLAKALNGPGPMGARLRSAERRAAVMLRVAARQVSSLEAAAGARGHAEDLSPALTGSARRLSYLADRIPRGRVPADALTQYSAAGQMVYDACA